MATGRLIPQLGQCCDAADQAFGCAMPNAVRTQQILGGLKSLDLFAAAFAAGDVRFGKRGVGCVHLAVDKTAQKQLPVSARSHHFTLLDASSPAFFAGSSSAA